MAPRPRVRSGAWSSQNSIGVSFGYLVEDQEDAGDGTRLLKSIDLYEISLTATPMHGSTRVVSWKSSENGTSTTDAQWEDFQATTRAADRAHEGQPQAGEKGAQAGQGACREGQGRGSEEAKRNRPIKVKTFEV